MSESSLRQTLVRWLPGPARDVARALKRRLQRLPGWREYERALAGRQGLEVGGPSALFRERLPVYRVLASLDGVNFSHQTMWEGQLSAGGRFEFEPGRAGRQFIAEASALPQIDSGRYGAVLSSNCLEHVANPLRALREWIRVVEPGGALLLVLPNPASNFDHRRPVTSFEHLLQDERQAVGEDDLTHLDEILALHDLDRDPWAGGRENFERRSRDNLVHRGLHHHVFDLALMSRMAAHLGLKTVRMDTTATDFILLARTPT